MMMTMMVTATTILHKSQNALPDVRDEYPSTFDASCAVMLAPISSSREGEDGARFQANTSTSSSSSSSRRTYLRCAPWAASTIRTRRLPPPSDISYSTVVWSSHMHLFFPPAIATDASPFTSNTPLTKATHAVEDNSEK